MKTHRLKHRHDRRREKRYVVVTRSLIHTSNNSMKTHQLKHTHDRMRERRYMVVTSSLIHQNNLMKTYMYPLKHRHDKRRKKEIRGGYSQPNTSNNSIKTHPLKHGHDRRREKRYVVVNRSLIHQ